MCSSRVNVHRFSASSRGRGKSVKHAADPLHTSLNPSHSCQFFHARADSWQNKYGRMEGSLKFVKQKTRSRGELAPTQIDARASIPSPFASFLRPRCFFWERAPGVEPGQWETRIDEEINRRSPLIRNSRLRFHLAPLVREFLTAFCDRFAAQRLGYTVDSIFFPSSPFVLAPRLSFLPPFFCFSFSYSRHSFSVSRSNDLILPAGRFNLCNVLCYLSCASLQYRTMYSYR